MMSGEENATPSETEVPLESGDAESTESQEAPVEQLNSYSADPSQFERKPKVIPVPEPVAEEPAPEPEEAPKKPRRKVPEATALPPPPAAGERHWYVLKVQSNREDTIKDAIIKRLKIASLEQYLNEIVVPKEKVLETKAGKKRIIERKFFPGYIMVNLELNDDVWFVMRETPGVGDFVGAGGKPVPMTDADIAKMLGKNDKKNETPTIEMPFAKGDRIKIKEGPFENFEGDVDDVVATKGLVRVMIQVFGRPAPVELEYWQVEKV